MNFTIPYTAVRIVNTPHNGSCCTYSLFSRAPPHMWRYLHTGVRSLMKKIGSIEAIHRDLLPYLQCTHPQHLHNSFSTPSMYGDFLGREETEYAEVEIVILCELLRCSILVFKIPIHTHGEAAPPDWNPILELLPPYVSTADHDRFQAIAYSRHEMSFDLLWDHGNYMGLQAQAGAPEVEEQALAWAGTWNPQGLLSPEMVSMIHCVLSKQGEVPYEGYSTCSHPHERTTYQHLVIADVDFIESARQFFWRLPAP